VSARSKVRDLAHASLASGDPLAWFDRVYEQADGATDAVPWADLAPNAALVTWLGSTWQADSARALVVGCGLGDDAEYLAARGADVTAFDLSSRAVAWCTQRFPASRVRYETADLLAPPPRWLGAFDLVFEAYTIQSLPPGSAQRAHALDVLRRFLVPAGELLVVARYADVMPAVTDGPPWPLVRREIDVAGEGLEPIGFDDFLDDGTRRVRASWRAPGA
jgi:SAM-dependent methyltransferase